jgi:glycine/D-amino acid oxidase-like deaminating enzyme
VLDTLGGALRSELAVVAATELALSHGASVRYHTTVSAIEPRSDGVRVVTSDGEVLAERVVLTAGPWTTRLLPDLADIVKVATLPLIWFIPRHIEMFTPGRFPGFMRDLHDVHAFGIPSLDGYSVKATPSLGLPQAGDWDDRGTTIPRERLKWAGEQIQKMIPDLIPEPSRWSLHGESVAANKMPVIDTVADGAVIVATALSGNGFKFSPVWGETLAVPATASARSRKSDPRKAVLRIGGRAPLVICRDADIGQAIAEATEAGFFNHFQTLHHGRLAPRRAGNLPRGGRTRRRTGRQAHRRSRRHPASQLGPLPVLPLTDLR